MGRRRAPDGLADRGRKLWADVTKAYDLRPDEYAILADACGTADLVARLEVEVAASPLLTTGSMKQPVVSPLVTELRLQRAALDALLRSLRLPDEVGAARPAARARERSGRYAVETPPSEVVQVQTWGGRPKP